MSQFRVMLRGMGKSPVAAKTQRARASGAYRVLGTLPDGVKVLAPRTKATHFTASEIRKTIKKLRREGKITKNIFKDDGVTDLNEISDRKS